MFSVLREMQMMKNNLKETHSYHKETQHKFKNSTKGWVYRDAE